LALNRSENEKCRSQIFYMVFIVVARFYNILEPTTGVTFFIGGFKSDPTELFPSIVLVIGGEKRFPPPNFNLTPKIPFVF
jgi:hypothetical protein